MSTYVWLVKLPDSETIPIRLSLDIALVGVLKMEISNFVVILVQIFMEMNTISKHMFLTFRGHPTGSNNLEVSSYSNCSLAIILTS